MAKKQPAKKPTMPPNLVRALADRKQSTDSETLLTHIMEVWGGPRQLAIDLHSEFQESKKGGMTRQRILEMLQRLILVNTTHEIGSAPRPADLSDEELEQAAMGYVKRVLGDDHTSTTSGP